MRGVPRWLERLGSFEENRLPWTFGGPPVTLTEVWRENQKHLLVAFEWTLDDLAEARMISKRMHRFAMGYKVKIGKAA